MSEEDTCPCGSPLLGTLLRFIKVTSGKVKQYHFRSDFHQGWLVVPKSDIPVGMVFSPLSHQDDDHFYLEEDYDMKNFLNQVDFEVEIIDTHDEYIDNHPIRNMRRA